MITPVPTRPRPIVRTRRGALQAKIDEHEDVRCDVQQPQQVDNALIVVGAAELAAERRSAAHARPETSSHDGTLVRQRSQAATSQAADKTTTVARRPMRVAVISDIHANEAALDAVLEAIDAASVDAVWCLGDVVGYGPHRTVAARSSAAVPTPA